MRQHDENRWIVIAIIAVTILVVAIVFLATRNWSGKLHIV